MTAGQQLAERGDSGNSSDPHVHFQSMDGTGITTAHGLPFEWEYAAEEGTAQRGVPANEELFAAAGPRWRSGTTASPFQGLSVADGRLGREGTSL